MENGFQQSRDLPAMMPVALFAEPHPRKQAKLTPQLPLAPGLSAKTLRA
jgi:hypothetical protein